jgi:uncharacterized membrane protein YheB (UPF0754 family)
VLESGAALGWWALRWKIFRSLDRNLDERLWSLAELVCAAVTLATLAAVVAIIAVHPFAAVPSWILGWHLQLLLAGAVGYGTNFLAVQMLFKPREPFRSIPLRWIWRQGLIPAKQTEVAKIVGEEVAERLLTPEAIVSEFERLLTSALEVRSVLESIQRTAAHVLERELPVFVRRFLPETLDALRDAVAESLPAEEMKRMMLEIVGDWFKSPKNQQALAGYLLTLVKARTPELVKLLKRTLKRYSKTSTVRGWAIGTGIATNIIDWDDFETALNKQLDSDKSREWAVELVADLARQIQDFANRVISEEWLETVKHRAGGVALDAVERVAEQTLIPRIVGLLERESFQRYVREELLPAMKPRILAWVREGHLAPFLERFDVKGRVEDAAASLDIDELEEMANRVGAYHLAAIQVLGYFLGLAVGVLAVLLDRVS